MRYGLVANTVSLPYQYIVGFAQPRRILCNGIHHGLQLGRRGCDHTQDSARGGLPLQCAAELLRLRIESFLQSGVSSAG